MSTEVKRFYLAASMAWSGHARAAARAVAESTGWECCARWTQWEKEPGGVPEVARIDADDVAEADVLVWLGGPPESGGKHAELGMALALEIPVLWVEHGWQSHPEVLRRLAPGVEHRAPGAAPPERCIFLTLVRRVRLSEVLEGC